jgi:RimJ/RimL family protein N-acetyltransferase
MVYTHRLMVHEFGEASVTLQTERLILRPWTPGDFEAFAAMHAEPDIMRYLSVEGKPLTRFQSWQAFCANFGHWQLRGFGMFAVVERATNEFVGRIGPWHPEGWPGFEVGWTIRQKFWGRGYATEAARRSVEFAFTELGRDSLISLIEENNVRSIRVAERLGEKPEGTVTLSHMPSRPIVKYGLSKRDWVR